MTGQMDLFGGSDESSTPEESRNTESSRRVESPGRDFGRFAFPDVLAEHLYTAGLGRGRIRLASDLMRLEKGLSNQQRRALFMAVIVGLEAQAQGSTFVPISGDYTTRRFAALIPDQLVDDESGWEPTKLASEMRTLVARPDLDLVGGESDWKPLVVSQSRLYHQRMMLYESRLVDGLATRLKRNDHRRDDERLKTALADVRRRQPPGKNGEPIRLGAEQEYALLTALHRPLTLITGGPGTGKTSIVVSVLRMLVRLGVSPASMALAAPTGKAAHRMAESIYGQLAALDDPSDQDRALIQNLEEPRTLHRLMGYSPRRDRFEHHAHNPLGHRMVIVDEASMIDLFLMQRLLEAVSPGAQLVLLGDADQLPSVDTGAVLRDLIPDTTSTDADWRTWIDAPLETHSGDAPTADVAVRLQTSYRMRADDPAGRQILMLARSIRDYDDGPFELPRAVDDIEQLSADFGGVRLWEPTDGDDQPTTLTPFVNWWFSEVILGSEPSTWRRRFNAVYDCDERGRLTEQACQNVQKLLDHFARCRVLTLTRVFSTGSEELNRRFHRSMARFGARRRKRDYDFHPGEPVMMLRNDYERDLFNGDQGVVVWCRPRDAPEQTPTPTAVFERSDGITSYPVGELGDDLEHAFAMTVHKSQGSEFERIALVLPDEPMALLNRELLYTGLTRASRAVVIAGRGRLLEAGASQRTERFSAVGEKLAARSVRNSEK